MYQRGYQENLFKCRKTWCQCLCPEKTYHVQEKQDIRGKEKRECSRKVHDNQERIQFMKHLEYEILLNGYHKI